MRRILARYPLRGVLAATVVALLAVTSGVVWYLTFREGRAAIEELAVQLGRQSMANVRQHLKSYLRAPLLINSINRFGFELPLAFFERELLLRRFAAEIGQFGTVSSIAYASAKGDYAGISRGAFGESLGIDVENAGTHHHLERFHFGPGGRPGTMLARSSKPYDPRQRPWYRSAVDSGTESWTDIYPWTNGEVGIDSATPIYREDGSLRGVVDTSLTLDGVGSFLKGLSPAKHSQAFIIDHLGMVVAASSISKPYVLQKGQLERLFVTDSADPAIRAAGTHIMHGLGIGKSLVVEHDFTIRVHHETDLVYVSPFRLTTGIDWILVEVIPERDFAAQIYDNMRLTAIFVALALLVSAGIALILARGITAPLELLNTMAGSMAEGDLSGTLDVHGTDEVAQLASSFNFMAERLRSSFDSLSASEARYRAIFHRSAASLWEADISELDAELDALRARSRSELEAYVRNDPDFIAHALQSIKITDVNETTLKLFEAKSRDELLGPIASTIDPASLAGFAPKAIADARYGEPQEIETVVMTRTGKRLNVLIHIHVPPEGDVFRRMLVSVIDITKRRQAEEERALLEEQLRHAQKMESVGQLAGSIAHDINNFITPIISYADLIRDGNEKLRVEAVNVIFASGQRVRQLTEKLLAFSRKQRLAKSVVDLRKTIDDIEPLLRPAIAKIIDLRIESDENLFPVAVDVGQIEQVLMNLVINARDAMPSGGTLCMRLRNVLLDERWTRSRCGVSEGEYVSIAVSDTGTGMTEKTRRRLFEPFFTTKEPGKGTGLGLSTVYRIVKQHGGHIEVDSELGRGSVFTVYLPAHICWLVPNVNS